MLIFIVSEVVEAGRGKGASRNLVHSKQSLSFNKQRRSGVERVRATSMDMMAVVSKSVTENATQDLYTCLRGGGHRGKDMGSLQPGVF